MRTDADFAHGREAACSKPCGAHQPRDVLRTFAAPGIRDQAGRVSPGTRPSPGRTVGPGGMVPLLGPCSGAELPSLHLCWCALPRVWDAFVAAPHPTGAGSVSGEAGPHATRLETRTNGVCRWCKCQTDLVSVTSVTACRQSLYLGMGGAKLGACYNLDAW